jgi:hypothetical protein
MILTFQLQEEKANDLDLSAANSFFSFQKQAVIIIP